MKVGESDDWRVSPRGSHRVTRACLRGLVRSSAGWFVHIDPPWPDSPAIKALQCLSGAERSLAPIRGCELPVESGLYKLSLMQPVVLGLELVMRAPDVAGVTGSWSVGFWPGWITHRGKLFPTTLDYTQALRADEPAGGGNYVPLPGNCSGECVGQALL